MGVTVERSSVTLADLVDALNEQRRSPRPPQCALSVDAASPPPASAEPLLVLGAHPGAGASTVALALAELATTRHAGVGPVRLVDAASGERSGLVCAAEQELGQIGDWLTGRRGGIELYRPAADLVSAADIPAVPSLERGVLVIDAGWSPRELAMSASPLASLLLDNRFVLVCRVSVPGVRRAELALADLPGTPYVVAMGASRWPGPVRASFGPRLGEAFDAGRLLVVPTVRRLALCGLDAQPVPRAVTGALAPLAADLWPTSQVTGGRRWNR